MRKTRTDDGSWTYYSEKYGQTFHSSHGAVTESRQVFLQASNVCARLRARQPTRVLEVGFGLGLNFLLTADFAAQAHCDLHYLALENSLIAADVFTGLEYASLVRQPEIHEIARRAFLAGKSCIVEASPGTLSNSLCELRLEICNFTDAILPQNSFDTVYLDAFSPDSNPECWDEPGCNKLFSCLKNGGTLSTYSAKGSVRRALLAAGFDVEKLAGPPGKREILRATASKEYLAIQPVIL